MRRASLNMVHELARQDSRVVFIGSDLGPGTMDGFSREFPDRYFMEGVAEMNMIGMAAGLAMEGFIPYVNTIATFLTRRCFEQTAIDICLHDLPVRLIGNGGGLVYAPLGPTHMATDDFALMRSIPNMTIVSPSDAEEMKSFMAASLDHPGPIYVRLGKGGDPIIHNAEDQFKIGEAVPKTGPGGILIVSTGVMTAHCLEAREKLGENGHDCAVLHFPTVKPLDDSRLTEYAEGARLVVSVEEHSLIGGLGSAVLESLNQHAGTNVPPVLRLGLPDRFSEIYGSQEEQLEILELDAGGIAARIADYLAGNRLN